MPSTVYDYERVQIQDIDLWESMSSNARFFVKVGVQR